MQALNLAWQVMPPASMALRRISARLGIEQPQPRSTRKSTPEEAMQQAMRAGIPVFEGRPDDPMLDLLDI